MIWRSTLVFLTSLTVLTLPVASLRAENRVGQLVAQSSAVDPGAAIDTGKTTPNFGRALPNAPLGTATSEQQVQEIRNLQQELRNRGYYNGPIDGIYGPGTEDAVNTLRGQEGVTPTPRQFTPGSTPSIETAAPVDRNGQPGAPKTDPDSAGNDTEASESNDTSPNGVSIGDQVSPTTGVTTSEPEQAPSPTAPVSQSESSPGLRRHLWPGLALIAALGSFGIGFILANRVHAHADDDDESSWGTVPKDLSPIDSGPQPGGTGAMANGTMNVNNGHLQRIDNDADLVIPSHRNSNGHLPSLSTSHGVDATTSLTKLDVLDQLVTDLQVAEPAKRRKAIWELGQRGNSSAVQHLVNRMVDADSKEKSLILAALSEIGIRSLKPLNRALAIALQDDNPDVRKNGIRDLTRVYDLVTQISQMLGHATEDEDPEVRRTAEWALGQLNRIREAPKLKSSLNNLEASRSTPELLPDEMENLKN